MSSFEVIGGKQLKGLITPQGAKNEALQILSAVVLTKQSVTISNIPDILDVNLLIELLKEMGVQVNRINQDTYQFQANDIDVDYLASEKFRQKSGRLRGSVMLAGPLLARFKKAFIPKPGGDKIGRRRLDTHIIGFQKLGAHYAYDESIGCFTLTTNALKGCYMLLDEPSVTGTANIVMAAVLAEGTTTIYNAACEPYLQQLCSMLNRMGAKISGIGSNLLVIETKSEITIKNAGVQHLGIIPEKFQQLGIQFDIQGDDIYIPSQESYTIQTFMDGGILTISDHPWPGFTPDLLSIVLVVATQAIGSVLIHQKMFESRLFFTDKLIDMGAQIILCDPHRATVIGLGRKNTLRGITMSSPDIRAGQALLIAALSAEGKSTIQNIEQIDRGYQFIDQRLQSLGAEIIRKA
ncbi:MAG: UDP-N-acetylglucosamine 1-carboxyvinyltransferase [Sphingobacteriia bacterium 32-37-4]|nr:MAG: UDP-N-acetylglucosamine 1-carboxyvinyltransferase [Sphingobacteriia bacterium 32-37-4]